MGEQVSTARKISQTFNGAAEWTIAGGYFKLLSTVNAVDVELYRNGSMVLSADDVEGGFYQRGEFDRVKITTGASEAVSFLVAPDVGGSDRFTGDVDLIDQADRLVGKVQTFDDPTTIADQAFLLPTECNALAANYSHVQCLNPTGSGKVVFVDGIEYQLSTSDYVLLCSRGTALTTSYSTPKNKNIGGAAGSAEGRTQTNGSGLGTSILSRAGVAYQNQSMRFKAPLRLEAGEGVLLRPAAVNVLMWAYFEIREVTA